MPSPVRHIWHIMMNLEPLKVPPPGPILNILILLSLLNALFSQPLGQIALLKQFQQKIIDMKTSLTDIQASQCQIVQ